MTAEQEKEAVAAALAGRQRAHAPYSQFLVGAGLVTRSGAIFSGCNVENASYGLTICAERVAVGAAVAAGEKVISGLVVALEQGGAPCGACRQVLREFGADFPIVMVDPTGSVFQRTRLAELLPFSFGPENLLS